ncbi:hypothetical protein [Pseudomonas sp. Irchel s3a10]|uniref:hypothetical protein n=1 Tax=Pseudomonas sp. Irchel s3a10 TaxID=2009045 RepID=UPI00117BBB3A|nr:hypothetical protein [Pseudomonas sp. Irchel s3a10]
METLGTNAKANTDAITRLRQSYEVAPLGAMKGWHNMKDYIRFDRFIDLETSLELLLVQIQGVPMTATCWKWAVIAAHSALQSSVCIALRGSASFDTLKPKSRDKWLEAYEKNKDLPNTQIDNFMA